MSIEQETIQSKRALNKERIRLSLLEEATKLFSSKGYENTTVADIVLASDIGRGTFYNYYTDVKDIFNAVVEKINVEIRATTKSARAQGNTVYDIFYLSFKAYFDLVSSTAMKGFHDKNQAYIRSASYKSAVIKGIVEDLKSDIEKATPKIKFKDEKSQQLLTYVLVATPAELYLNNMSVNKSFNNEEVAQFLAELFSNGITPAAV